MLHHHVRFKYVTRSDGGQERNHFICNLSVTLHISDEQKFVEQGGRGLRLEKSSSPLLSLDSCCGLLSLEQSKAHIERSAICTRNQDGPGAQFQIVYSLKLREASVASS
jgi:hypothetical protein